MDSEDYKDLKSSYGATDIIHVCFCNTSGKLLDFLNTWPVVSAATPLMF